MEGAVSQSSLVDLYHWFLGEDFTHLQENETFLKSLESCYHHCNYDSLGRFLSDPVRSLLYYTNPSFNLWCASELQRVFSGLERSRNFSSETPRGYAA